ncbi:MAG: type II toxin-antitoxin system HicB family antitoxin [Bacteroidia bacterium]
MNDVLTYKGYTGTVEFNAADQVLHGKVAGINDLVTYEGDSIKQLYRGFKEAVDDYLETCNKLGKEPEKVYKGIFNVRINPELHKQAALLALKSRITMNDFVHYAISLAVNMDGKFVAEEQVGYGSRNLKSWSKKKEKSRKPLKKAKQIKK